MKILVTGGAGFIGSALIRHIIKNTQHSVVNLDKLTYAGNLDSLCDVQKNANYCFENIDIFAISCNSRENPPLVSGHFCQGFRENLRNFEKIPPCFATSGNKGGGGFF